MRGYVHWVALAADGTVWTCNTGFDGYAGLLPSTQQTGGWWTPNAEHELGWAPQPGSWPVPGESLRARTCSYPELEGQARPCQHGLIGRCCMPSLSMMVHPALLLTLLSTNRALMYSWVHARYRALTCLTGLLLTGRVEGLKAIAVAAGRCTTLAVDAAGQAWSWGCGFLGREGDPARPASIPRLGPGTPAGPVVELAAGEWTFAAVTTAGKVRLVPGMVEVHAWLYSIVCIMHCSGWSLCPPVILAQSNSVIALQVFVWGGTGEEQFGTVNEPRELKDQPSGLRPVAISGGQQHFLLIYSQVSDDETTACRCICTSQCGLNSKHACDLKRCLPKPQAACP